MGIKKNNILTVLVFCFFFFMIIIAYFFILSEKNNLTCENLIMRISKQSDYKIIHSELKNNTKCLQDKGNSLEDIVFKAQFYRYDAIAKHKLKNDEAAKNSADKALKYYSLIPDKEKKKIKDNFDFVDTITSISEGNYNQ